MEKQYHNTTGETGTHLEAFTKVAKSQDEIVLSFFTKNKGIGYSPSYVHEQLIIDGLINITTPLTSIRRALTNLTVSGKLVKTTEKVLSKYKRSEYIWRLK